MTEEQAEYKAREFGGFDIPKQNWSKLPHQFIEALPIVDSLSEMKVILYILRHTWGFQEFDSLKKITLDEFENGRMKKDRTRLDNGIGMAKSSIIRGLNKAVEHGFIVIEEDNRDKARKKRMYRIATSNVSKRYIGGSETIHRTEKDTLEEIPKKGASPSEKEIVESFKKDTQDYISKSNAIPEDNRDWQGYPPDVIPYLKAFAGHFRMPFKDEKSKWLKIARKWISRGYNVADVHNAAQHHLEKDLDMGGPESITYAFDAGSKKSTGRKKRATKVFGEAPEGWYD